MYWSVFGMLPQNFLCTKLQNCDTILVTILVLSK